MKMKCYVKAGAKFLDENYAGWHKFIDEKKLDLQFSNRCIIGQLTEHWPSLMYTALEVKDEFGFNLIEFGMPSTNRRRQWIRLKQLWLAEVRGRMVV